MRQPVACLERDKNVTNRSRFRHSRARCARRPPSNARCRTSRSGRPSRATSIRPVPVAARAGLPMPRSPRVPRVVELEIRNPCFLDRGAPGGIGRLPADRLAAKGEAEHRMLAALVFEHGRRIAIQRDASRRSVLGPVDPGGRAFQINPVPFQPGDLPRAAACREREAGQRGEVRRTFGDEPRVLQDGSHAQFGPSPSGFPCRSKTKSLPEF